MKYVDGFVAAVPTANREKYKAHVEYSAAVFKDHGATRVVECWGDDVPDGELTSFPKAVQKKEDETICFSLPGNNPAARRAARAHNATASASSGEVVPVRAL